MTTFLPHLKTAHYPIWTIRGKGKRGAAFGSVQEGKLSSRGAASWAFCGGRKLEEKTHLRRALLSGSYCEKERYRLITHLNANKRLGKSPSLCRSSQGGEERDP